MKDKPLKKYEKNIILLIGSYFLILGLVAVARSLYKQMSFQLFYVCYIGILLIGVGILTKKGIVILSQIYILAIPLFVWTIDFLYFLIFKQPLWNITNYFFSDNSNLLDSFITLQHVYTIPLALYATKLIGFKEIEARKWSFIQLSIIFIIVSTFSPSRLNINCVFSSCIDIPFGIPYKLVWFLVWFGMIEISYFTLKYFLPKM